MWLICGSEVWRQEGRRQGSKAGNSSVDCQLTISRTDSLQSVEGSYQFSLFQFEVQIVGLKSSLTVKSDSRLSVWWYLDIFWGWYIPRI